MTSPSFRIEPLVERGYQCVTLEERVPSAMFHVAEDEINHRGQMPWLRARLRTAAARPTERKDP